MAAPSPKKNTELLERMEQLAIVESDLEEEFIRGSGAGGQKINKTSSCVRLKHIPSGIEVRCQASRSQTMNRFEARRLLCEKIAKQIFQEKTAADALKEKIKRQKKRRSRKAKEKVLKDKKLNSEKKSRRLRPDLNS